MFCFNTGSDIILYIKVFVVLRKTVFPFFTS